MKSVSGKMISPALITAYPIKKIGKVGVKLGDLFYIISSEEAYRMSKLILARKGLLGPFFIVEHKNGVMIIADGFRFITSFVEALAYSLQAAAITSSSEEAPTEEAPTEEAPTEEAPTEEAPTEEAPTEEAPTEIESSNFRHKGCKACLMSILGDDEWMTFDMIMDRVKSSEYDFSESQVKKSLEYSTNIKALERYPPVTKGFSPRISDLKWRVCS